MRPKLRLTCKILQDVFTTPLVFVSMKKEVKLLLNSNLVAPVMGLC